MIARFVKYARWLQKAGWQPVTHARLMTDNVRYTPPGRYGGRPSGKVPVDVSLQDTRSLVLERYGNELTRKDPVYFALLNPKSWSQTVHLGIDVQQFSDLPPGAGVVMKQFKLIGGTGKSFGCVRIPDSGELHYRVTLDPDKAQVLQLRFKQCGS